MTNPPASIRPDAPAPVRPGWRAHLAAVLVTFHIACVLIYALPRPPAVDDETLEHPEVKAELEQGLGALQRWLPMYDTPQDLRADLLKAVRTYVAVTDRGRNLVEPYLDFAGGTQSWHMFGGTPPRFPLVFVVEVQPAGKGDYVLFQDLRWGTEDSAAMNFRHRKAQERLSILQSRNLLTAYAAHWARRWDERHPKRPARRVRLSYTRLTTPAPEQVRRGEADRQPEHGVQPFVWERPE